MRHTVVMSKTFTQTDFTEFATDPQLESKDIIVSANQDVGIHQQGFIHSSSFNQRVLLSRPPLLKQQVLSALCSHPLSNLLNITALPGCVRHVHALHRRNEHCLAELGRPSLCSALPSLTDETDERTRTRSAFSSRASSTTLPTSPAASRSSKIHFTASRPRPPS